jgi:hypothetical protein
LLIEPNQPGEAAKIASELHPNWGALKQAAKKLMARNSRQILGLNLDNPVKFVLCWTPDGCEHGSTRSRKTGGTGQAITLASIRYDIPVFNMKNTDALDRLKLFLK